MRSRLRTAFQRLQRHVAVRENVHLMGSIHIGPGSVLWAPHQLIIGTDVYIGKHCTIEVDGSIGDGTLIANNVGIVGRRDHDHTAIGAMMRHAPWVGDPEGPDTGQVVLAGDNWIGFGAIILAPCDVGRGAIVAAGSVVTRSVDPYAIVAGNPARKIAERFNPEERDLHEYRLGLQQRRFT